MNAVEIRQRVEEAKRLSSAGRTGEAVSMLEQDYAQSVDVADPELLTELCLAIGSERRQLGDYAQAEVWYRRAAGLGEEIGDLSVQAAAVGNLGTLNLIRAEHDEALRHLERAYGLFIEAGNVEATGPLLMNIGMVHASKGDLASGLEWYYRALEHFTDHGDQLGIAYVSGAIGDLFYDAAEYDQALAWYERSLKVVERLDHQALIVTKLCQLGRVYGSLHQSELEIAHLTKAVALAAAYQLERELIIARAFLATAMMRCGDHERALELIELALPDARSRGLREQELDLLLVSAQIAVAQQRNDAAADFLSSVLTLSTELGLEKYQHDAHHQLYQLERDRDPIQALHHLEQSVDIRRRHLSEQKQRRIALLDMEHRLSVERKAYEAQMEQERRLREQQRELLTNMMPERIAESLMAGATMIADSYDDVSIMFLDLVNFTELASSVTASEVVVLLNNIFNLCDEVIIRHGLTKIKTIGDAYLAVGGAPDPLDDHAVRMALAAIEINEQLKKTNLSVRIGLHCGPITAGVIGEYRKAYDVWGDAVNVAARMEQSCERGRIHATEVFAVRCAGREGLHVVERGRVEVKGKGAMTTYWLSRS